MSDSNVPSPEVDGAAGADGGVEGRRAHEEEGHAGKQGCSADGQASQAGEQGRKAVAQEREARAREVAEAVCRAKRGDGEARRGVANGGDADRRDAKRWLFEEFREVAYRVAMRITGKEADAMDVVQDGFMKAFASLDSLVDEGRFKTWLLRIVHNKALDTLRSRKVRKAVAFDRDDGESWAEQFPSGAEDDPSADMSKRETRALIAEAFDSLPPDQRVVLSLFAAGSMTYGEIAEVVGAPLGTVMSRLYRARRRMKELLGDLDAGPAAGTAGPPHAEPPPIGRDGFRKRNNS